MASSDELDTLRGVAEKARTANAENGHCGEGTLERRERLARADAALAALHYLLTPDAVLRLLDLPDDARRERDAAKELARFVKGELDAAEAALEVVIAKLAAANARAMAAEKALARLAEDARLLLEPVAPLPPGAFVEKPWLFRRVFSALVEGLKP